MVTTQQRQATNPRALVEEELLQISANQLAAAVRNTAMTLRALGIIEIVFGAATLFTPAFARPFFILLLGGAVLISSVVNTIAAIVLRSPGRLALGVVSAAAGVLIIGHPLFGLSFLTALVGIYLAATGIARFFEPPLTPLAIVNAIVGIVFGIVILLSPAASPFLIGLLAGINLIINGIHTASISTSLRKTT